jgi:hypothetical protein
MTPSQKLEVSGNVLATSYMTSSDRSLKENIIPLPDALEKILSLRGYSFNWKNDGREDIGIIEVLPKKPKKPKKNPRRFDN